MLERRKTVSDDPQRIVVKTYSSTIGNMAESVIGGQH